MMPIPDYSPDVGRYALPFEGRLKSFAAAAFLVMLAGALTPLAFAPYRLFWLMPLLIAALPAVAVLHGRRNVLLAYLWGFAAYLAQNYWVYISLHHVAGLPSLYALPLTVLLPLYLALFPAAVFALLNCIRLPPAAKTAVLFPALWVLAEYTREHLFTGFGWGITGYSQITESPLAAFAPLGGVHLVSLAVLCAAAWLFCLIFSRRVIARAAALGGIVLLYAAGGALYGKMYTQGDGERVRVALVQGNIAQTLKFDPGYLVDTIRIYYEEVAQIIDADVVILPESAVPILRESLPEGVLAQFASTARRNGADLAAGIVQETADGKGYLNAVINLADYRIDTPPDAVPYYAKQHLVPFGEFRPLPALTAWLYRLMDMPLSDFSRGGVQQPPLLMAGQKIAFNICYEDGFGDELIAGARHATVLANVSNLAWFGNSHAMDLQLQHSQTRALELGRYMLRATNTGLTAAVAPNGEIHAMIPRDTRQTLHATVEGFSGETPYMQSGSRPLMWLLALLVAAAALLGAWLEKRRRKE